GARVGAQPLHAFAERARESRRRREDGHAHRRRVPRSHKRHRLHRAVMMSIREAWRVLALASYVSLASCRAGAVGSTAGVASPDSMLIRRNIEYLASEKFAGRLT